MDDHFLLSDMAVKCFRGRHPAAMALSGLVICMWATVPLSVVWMGRRRPETHHDPRFKFLFGEFVCLVHTQMYVHCSMASTVFSCFVRIQLVTSETAAGGRRW